MTIAYVLSPDTGLAIVNACSPPTPHDACVIPERASTCVQVDPPLDEPYKTHDCNVPVVSDRDVILYDVSVIPLGSVSDTQSPVYTIQGIPRQTRICSTRSSIHIHIW